MQGTIPGKKPSGPGPAPTPPPLRKSLKIYCSQRIKIFKQPLCRRVLSVSASGFGM